MERSVYTARWSGVNQRRMIKIKIQFLLTAFQYLTV